MSEPWWSMQRSTENKEDHSSEWMEKCAQKVFDRAGIVRDVREPDKPDGMRRPVSSGMRYAPNVRRAQGTKKETGNEED